MKKYSFMLFVLLMVTQITAQEILTIDDAVQLTLENNYDIKVVEKNVEVAKNNTSIYNSGYLPTVSSNGGLGYTDTNSELEGQDGAVTKINGASSTNYNASVGLNYVLFDGLNRKYTFERLQQTYNLSELQATQVVENTLLNLYFSYYEVARLFENENNQKQTLEISKRRLLRATYSANYGQSTKLDVLNAEVDMNNDSINYLNGQRELANAKRNLNVVLGRNIALTDFNVETELNYLLNLAKESLLQSALTNNTTLLQVNKGIEVGNIDIAISKSGWMPVVSANGSYGWNGANNDETFSLANQQSNGLNAGLSLGWNIFDGGRTKTRVQNAKIIVESQEIEKEQYKQKLTRDVYNAWEFYQNKLFTYSVQETNVETNKRNFDRTNEQYKLGQINSIDFRLAQVNLLNAERDLSQSKYNAKNAEFQLLFLAGMLLNN